jgi:flagellar basal-body rod protein FlgF
MSDATSQVSSGINALMQEFHVITNNLANVSTVGYKRRCSVFSQSLRDLNSDFQTELAGEVNSDVFLDFSQGDIVETGRPLDLSLYGKGFFVIETQQGPLYARNGVFHTNQNGQIVDSAGRIISSQFGPVVIPPTVGLSQIHISSDGSISADGLTIGRFRIVDFGSDEDKLVPAGANCYLMPENIEPVAADNVVVKQGYQEASNVKMIDELVNMIVVSRLYEANMKFVSARKEVSNSIMSVAMG